MDTRDELQRWLVRGSFITLLGRISFGAIVILQSAVLSRLLDGSDLGAYLLLQSTIVPAMLVALFGADLLAVAWIGSQRNIVEVILSCSTVVAVGSLLTGITFAAGLSAAAVTPAAAWVIVAESRWLVVPLVILSSTQTLLGAIFRGLRSIGRATLLNGVLSSSLLLAVCFGAYGGGLHLSAYTAIVLQLATLSLSVLYGIIEIVRYLHLQRAHLTDAGRRRHTAKEIWVTGTPIMMTQVLAFISTQSDIWIVSTFASSDSVAGYGLAARLAQLVSLPHLVLNLDFSNAGGASGLRI